MNKVISFCIFYVLIAYSISCKKENPTTNLQFITDSITDIDGNVYQTIKIGSQWWMMENLNVTKYKNGIEINSTNNNSDWEQDSVGMYSQYDNNENAPGLLYNWYAVTNRHGIAPEGWHVATDNDWKILEKYLGMNPIHIDSVSWRGTNEGDKLKANDAWTIVEDIKWYVWATNESGFTALAGSCKLQNGKWGSPGIMSTGFWWTASDKNSNAAWYRYLDYKKSEIFRSTVSKNYGMSIRCVKN